MTSPNSESGGKDCACVNKELLDACKGAARWLEGWASAEPYLSALHAAIAKAEDCACVTAADDALALARLRKAVSTAWRTGTEDFRRHYDKELFAVLGVEGFQDLYPAACVTEVSRHG